MELKTAQSTSKASPTSDELSPKQKSALFMKPLVGNAYLA
jgi:hypothetical protein